MPLRWPRCSSWACGLPLAMMAVAGGVGIPSDDDWIYILGADNLYRHGSPAMPGHTAAAVGQIVLVQPLLWLSGGGTWAYTAFGLLASLVAVAATYLLARWFVGPGLAALAALLLVAFPGVARLAPTFMTDVPALALELLSLLLGGAWLRTGRRSALAASLAVGVAGGQHPRVRPRRPGRGARGLVGPRPSRRPPRARRGVGRRGDRRAGRPAPRGLDRPPRRPGRDRRCPRASTSSARRWPPWGPACCRSSCLPWGAASSGSGRSTSSSGPPPRPWPSPSRPSRRWWVSSGWPRASSTTPS